jgi:hypothetical protein
VQQSLHFRVHTLDQCDSSGITFLASLPFNAFSICWSISSSGEILLRSTGLTYRCAEFIE